MSIIAGAKLHEEIKAGNIKIDPYDAKAVGPASVDLTLSYAIRAYKDIYRPIDLQEKFDYKDLTYSVDLREQTYWLMPGRQPWELRPKELIWRIISVGGWRVEAPLPGLDYWCIFQQVLCNPVFLIIKYSSLLVLPPIQSYFEREQKYVSSFFITHQVMQSTQVNTKHKHRMIF